MLNASLQNGCEHAAAGSSFISRPPTAPPRPPLWSRKKKKEDQRAQWNEIQKKHNAAESVYSAHWGGDALNCVCCVLGWRRKENLSSLPVVEGGAENSETASSLLFFFFQEEEEENENVICVCLAVMGQRQNAGSVPWEFWKVFWLGLLVVIGVICLQMFILTGGEKLRSFFLSLSFFSSLLQWVCLVIGKCYQRQIGHTWLLKGSRDRHCDLVNDWTWPPADFSVRHALSSCAGNGTLAR